MRTTGHNVSRLAVGIDLTATAAGALVGCGAIVLAASLFGCGDADAKKPGTPTGGAVLAAPNGSTTTVAQFADAAEVSAAAFTRDAGGRLLDDHLAPPQYVPIEPPPLVAEPVERPRSKVESVNFEQLWQPPATAADQRVLVGERKLTERTLPLRDLPPLAASVAALPLAPGLSAGPLLLAASNDAADAGELPVSAPTPESLGLSDPASAAARAAANPVVAAGREGPAPFEAVHLPSPEEHDPPALPAMKSPPADADVYPAAGGRLLWSPVLPVPMPK